MPLIFAKVGEATTVVKVKGQDKTKRFLESLGFIEGAQLQIVAHHAGNVIVHIQSSRIAISKEMANKILVL